MKKGDKVTVRLMSPPQTGWLEADVLMSSGDDDDESISIALALDEGMPLTKCGILRTTGQQCLLLRRDRGKTQWESVHGDFFEVKT